MTRKVVSSMMAVMVIATTAVAAQAGFLGSTPPVVGLAEPETEVDGSLSVYNAALPPGPPTTAWTGDGTYLVSKFVFSAGTFANLLFDSHVLGVLVGGDVPNYIAIDGTSILIGNLGVTSETYSVITATPELASLGIWGALGLGAVAARRMRKRAAVAA